MNATANHREASDEPLVRMAGISKSFSGVTVLDSVDFEVLHGEVHALAGGNGAGKSTLMKILQGVYSLDKGLVQISGKEQHFASIQDAKSSGIGMVFQEFSLVPTLTVAQNIFLNAEPRSGGVINDAAMVKRAKELFQRMQVAIDPTAEMSSLPTAYWQLTEIAKALAEDAQILIMDEPTASLSQHEANSLFELIGRLTDSGMGVVYISHRMEEVYRIADRITILRNGKRLLTSAMNDITPEKIVESVAGKTVNLVDTPHRSCPQAPVVLAVEGIASDNGLHDISFEVHEGEVVGLAGLMGSGRTELVRALFGVDQITSGTVAVDGKSVSVRNPQDALENGIALVPEDRRLQGLVLPHSVNSNLELPHLREYSKAGWLNKRGLATLSSNLIEKFNIRVARPHKPAALLSGGNQQKIVLAKWLSRDPRVLLMDEPTAGVDIGTKAEIIEMVRSFAAAGHAVVVISSEYPELLAMSDRLLLMRNSTINKELDRSAVSDEQSLELVIQGVTTHA
ncbi:sugar ABC transporter ATP-binding protein [Cutibacterium avidum]|uniref:sugar ABC transporter ATP-binding protein n=1 Tax=Cutibacterium avidum TaxID=33010 RepID=UPI002FF3C672